MADKFFKYKTDLGAFYGATIDEALYTALAGADMWEAINATGVNGTLYDTFEELDTADADVTEMLPSDINPRTISVDILGAQKSIILPVHPSEMFGSIEALGGAVSVTLLPTQMQGESDFDLNN